jgi:hypothetical protein
MVPALPAVDLSPAVIQNTLSDIMKAAQKLKNLHYLGLQLIFL